MKLALLGSTSQIAKDLIINLQYKSKYKLYLYGRNLKLIEKWIKLNNLKNIKKICSYKDFNKYKYDVIINFVGISDPKKLKINISKVYEINLKYDDLSLKYIKNNPKCKYIYISSGAVFGGEFKEPVNLDSKPNFNINNIKENMYYGITKLSSEIKHRMLSDFNICDIRIFNYFSYTQNINKTFFLTEAIKSLKNKKKFITNNTNFYRDYIHPLDLMNLINCIIKYKKINSAFDCFSKKPTSKFEILKMLKNKFKLDYQLTKLTKNNNITGKKIKYYSDNKKAEVIKYSPLYSSLEGIQIEVDKFIKLSN